MKPIYSETNKPFVGDRVYVLLHSRAKGYPDTGGGWSSDWLPARIVKVNRKTARVLLSSYYYGLLHTLQFDRIRPDNSQ